MAAKKRVSKEKSPKVRKVVLIGLLVVLIGGLVAGGLYHGITALKKLYQDKPPVEQEEEQNEVEATNLPPEAAFYYNINID